MAIASVGQIGTAASSTSGNTLTYTSFPPNGAVGNVVIVIIAADNTGTTDADHSQVTGVSDSGGNTWTKLGEWTNGEGAAGSGVTCSMWMTRVASTISASITATFSGSIVDKCMAIWQFSVDADLQIAAGPITNTVDASVGIGSSSISGLSSAQRLYVRGAGKEANSSSSMFATSGFTEFSGTRSRNNASAIMVRGEFRINTSTGETSNPTLGVIGDVASVFVALEEVSGGPTFNPAWARNSNILLQPGLAR